MTKKKILHYFLSICLTIVMMSVLFLFVTSVGLPQKWLSPLLTLGCFVISLGAFVYTKSQLDGIYDGLTVRWDRLREHSKTTGFWKVQGMSAVISLLVIVKYFVMFFMCFVLFSLVFSLNRELFKFAPQFGQRAVSSGVIVLLFFTVFGRYIYINVKGQQAKDFFVLTRDILVMGMAYGLSRGNQYTIEDSIFSFGTYALSGLLLLVTIMLKLVKINMGYWLLPKLNSRNYLFYVFRVDDMPRIIKEFDKHFPVREGMSPFVVISELTYSVSSQRATSHNLNQAADGNDVVIFDSPILLKVQVALAYSWLTFELSVPITIHDPLNEGMSSELSFNVHEIPLPEYVGTMTRGTGKPSDSNNSTEERELI